MSLSDIILFAHPTFGVIAIMACVWVFIEALNASDAKTPRTPATPIRAASGSGA
jgi:hypothetical protein